MESPLLQVTNLHTHFQSPDKAEPAKAVNGVSFTVNSGEIVAIVGESGSGKSVSAYSLMRLLTNNAIHPEGEILFEGRNVLEQSRTAMQRIRGNEMSMIFQEPMTSLNPLKRISKQLMEPLQLHQHMPASDALTEAHSLLKQVGIPDPAQRLNDFPHQLSGGMRQRVMIAMALAARPKLLIADEPTTALDVTIQAQILGLMKDLQQNTGMGILFITHDLGVVNQIADRVYVMYAGRVMEEGHRTHVFDYMAHPYTRGLFASLPSMGTKRHRLQTITGSVPSAHETVPGCPFHPRCLEAWERCHTERPVLHEVEKDHASFCHLFDKDQSYNRDEDAWTPTTEKENTKGEAANDKEKQLLKVNNLKTHFPVKRGLFKRTVAHVRAVDDISFTLPTSHTIALVGESGCGKTTAGLSILRLIREATGSVVFNSDNIMTWDRNTLRNNRKNLQIVFQDPFSSLSPRLPVGKIVQEGLDVHFPDLTPEEKKQRVIDTLQEVGLSPDTLERYPHEFSGGQRQRISLARAFVLKPAFLVLDEPTSALDVSVQAQILNLLKDMQQKHHITYLFITHDLAVVRHIADTAAVMYLGKIVEYAPTDSLFKSPQHPYSRSLLKSIPRTDTRGELARLEGEVPSPLTPPQGCYFHPRCTLYKSGKENGDTALCNQCISAFPPLEQTDGHHTACYAVARETKPTSPLNSMES